MLDVMLDVALDLSTSLPDQDRYQRLVAAVSRIVPCDAAALLRLDQGGLRVVAATGLTPDALGRCFMPADHPRLAAILAAPGPLAFAADDPRPDPFDGLIAGAGSAGVHACLGCALRVGGQLVGALTTDALLPGAFNNVDLRQVATLSALAAAAVRTASLIEALEQLAERRQLVSRRLMDEALQRGGGQILGRSPVMLAHLDELEQVAPSDLTVLITGETGVGKELVARTLHARSSRAHQPLVYLNCAALPENIVESELFGHIKGAFTGAVGHRIGRFELADAGTLFLDEVGELPLAAQPKLLRALQYGEVQRVGADEVFQVDVRVLAATNHDLAAQVTAGAFRADLYHRLAVYPLHVPPLRERAGDVALLAGHFLERSRRQLGHGPARLSEPALRLLQANRWPGNVRELEHLLLRAAMRASKGRRGAAFVGEPEHLDLHGELLATAALPQAAAAAQEPPLPFRPAVEAYQKRLIRQAVAASDGNWAQAAGQLQLDRSNLHRLARRLGIKG